MFLEIFSNLEDYLTLNNIPHPVILVFDRYKGHLGLAIAEYCNLHRMQLVLLCANMIHVLQPLIMDLSLVLQLFLIKLFRCQSVWSFQVSLPYADPPLALQQPGGKLTKTTVISEVARPAFKSALSRRERE